MLNILYRYRRMLYNIRKCIGDSMKIPNLHIMDIEEGEYHRKGIGNIFNKIKEENVPKFRERAI